MLFEQLLPILSADTRPVILTGHENPDYDSIASCLLMQSFLKQCGVAARICLSGKPDQAELLDRQGYETASFFSAAPKDCLLILCDCHTTKLAGTVIACADHHPTSLSSEIPVYLNCSASSAARLIYQEGKNFGLKSDRQTAYLALSSIYMDTLSCTNSKFQESDRKWIAKTAARWNFDLDMLYRDGLCLTDLTLAPEVLARCGWKDYQFGNLRYASSYIQVENIPDKSLTEQILNACQRDCNSNKYSLWLFICYNLGKKTTTVYQYEPASGWNTHTAPGLLSRGNDLLPKLERQLAAHRSIQF